MTPLKEQIAARIQEARNKNISSKASTIARYLGTFQGDDDGGTSIYNVDPFKIEAGFGVVHGSDGDMGWSSITIQLNGSYVYEERGLTISSYIPGEWEKLLDSLHIEATNKSYSDAMRRAEEQDQDKKRKEHQERAKWGL